jgi:hypothetical protein
VGILRPPSPPDREWPATAGRSGARIVPLDVAAKLLASVAIAVGRFSRVFADYSGQIIDIYDVGRDTIKVAPWRAPRRPLVRPAFLR